MAGTHTLANVVINTLANHDDRYAWERSTPTSWTRNSKQPTTTRLDSTVPAIPARLAAEAASVSFRANAIHNLYQSAELAGDLLKEEPT